MTSKASRLARFNGNFQVPFWLAAEMGALEGIRVKDKFGLNLDVDINSTPEDVWSLGGIYTGFPVTGTAETLEIFSSDAADTAAGTGARTVVIEGLNFDYDEITETVTLNGTTGVLTTQEFWRVNRAFVETAGSGEANAGNITIRMSTTTANLMAELPAGTSQTQQTSFTVPRNHSAYIFNFQSSLVRSNGAAGSGQISIRVRDNIDGVFRARRLYAISDGQGVASPLDIKIPERSDIVIRVDSVSDNNSQVIGEYQFYLIRDNNGV